MNYFKGSGSCGINTFPSNKKTKESFKKPVLEQNVLLQKNIANGEARLAAKV